MTSRHRPAKWVFAALRGVATCLLGVGLIGAAAAIWALPSAAASTPSQGPASGVSVACDRPVTTPGSSLSCTITGLVPSESASVSVAGSNTQVVAPPADATGASTFTLPVPAAGTSTRTVEVTAPQSHRTTSTRVTVSDQIVGLPPPSPIVSGAGGGTPSDASAGNRTTIPTRALVAILVAVLGIVVLATRKRLHRMKA